MAALLGTSEAKAIQFLTDNAEDIAVEATRSQLAGETNKTLAMRLDNAGLKAGLKLAESEVLEPKDIKDLIGSAYRVIDDDTRKELASKAHTDAVVVEIYFENGGVTGHICQDTKPMADVVDVEIKTAPVAADTGSTPVRGTTHTGRFVPATVE